MNKSDEQLLAAVVADAQNEIAYLKRVLKTLVTNVREDIGREHGTEHLWVSVEDAEEALGLYNIG